MCGDARSAGNDLSLAMLEWDVLEIGILILVRPLTGMICP
jgi:hypothetical protein